MQQQNRRSFLRSTSLFSAAALAAPAMGMVPKIANAASSTPAKNNKRILGSGAHSIEVNYGLGLGCMGMSWNRSFVPYSPLSRAYLTGYINERTTYVAGNDNRPALPRYKADAVIANWRILDVIIEFGNQRGLTAAQVSLAWLMAQKPWIVPIPGTTKSAHLQDNLGSSDFVFTQEELRTFTEAINKIPVTGDRYATPQTR